MVGNVHLHPKWHVNGVATVEVDSQFQMVEPIVNEAVYYNTAAIFLIKYYLG